MNTVRLDATSHVNLSLSIDRMTIRLLAQEVTVLLERNDQGVALTVDEHRELSQVIARLRTLHPEPDDASL